LSVKFEPDHLIEKEMQNVGDELFDCYRSPTYFETKLVKNTAKFARKSYTSQNLFEAKRSSAEL
jgi:hypothetical protein